MEQRQSLGQEQTGVRVGIIYLVTDENGTRKVLTANNSSRDLLDSLATNPEVEILYSNPRLSGRQQDVLMSGLDEIFDKDYSDPAVQKAVSVRIRKLKQAGKPARGAR